MWHHSLAEGTGNGRNGASRNGSLLGGGRLGGRVGRGRSLLSHVIGLRKKKWEREAGMGDGWLERRWSDDGGVMAS